MLEVRLDDLLAGLDLYACAVVFEAEEEGSRILKVLAMFRGVVGYNGARGYLVVLPTAPTRVRS